MKILQISGSGRNCGKTTLGCALIAAFPRLRWVAFKLTRHRHSEAPQEPQDSGQDCNSEKDTDRFLSAGAIQASLLTSPPGLEFLADTVRHADVLLLESGQPVDAAGRLRLHLAVAPGNAALWKPDFARRIAALPPERPDALVLDFVKQSDVGKGDSRPNLPADLKVFSAQSSGLLTPALLAAVDRFLSDEIRR